MDLYLLCFITLTVAYGQQPATLCPVTMRVVDEKGRPQPYRVESFKNANGLEFAKQFVSLQGVVPCEVQLYSYQVVREGVAANVLRHTRIEGRFAVAAPETFVSVSTDPTIFISRDGSFAAALGRYVPEGYVWRGTISPLPREELWVYLRSAVALGASWIQQEAKVDANGDFRFFNLVLPGNYLLHIVNNDGEVVFSDNLKVQTGFAPIEPLTIRLSSPPPATIVR